MSLAPLRQFEACAPIFQHIDSHVADYVQDAIRICEVPAPTYKEEKRAEFFAEIFREMALNPSIDEAGNVEIPIFVGDGPRVVLSAHLDTVFQFDSIHVRREGTLLYAPGISDDSAGLAALVTIVRAFRECSFRAQGSLTLLASVGEEGLGNLRGVRHFFSRKSSEVDFFISIDGVDAERMVTRGLASKRLRIFFRGPGGHSWGDAGAANPIHACGELLSRIQRLVLPKSPKTALNVGIISGGTSVNAIPTEVHLDMDLRSEAADALLNLSEFVQRSVHEAAYGNDSLRTEIVVLGERPSGGIPDGHPLVLAATAANKAFGLPTHLDIGSTDSNIPFAMGIPAMTVGAGGKSGKMHTPDEWYDIRGAEIGLKRTALLVAELLQKPKTT